MTKMASCSSHFTNTMKTTVSKYFPDADKSTRNLVCELLLFMMKAKNFRLLKVYVIDLLNLLNRPTQDDVYRNSFFALQEIFNHGKKIYFKSGGI